MILALAAGAAVALITSASALFRPKTVGEHLDVVKIALAVVAGIGGVVALVVAYRRQRLAEAAQRLAETGEDREQRKLYAERFDKASDKLGSDSAAVRLAGVHALANLGDDWEEGRQTCIDVLCANLRMPSAPEPDRENDSIEYTKWRAIQEVRATIIRLIGTHLQADASRSWHGCNFDFSETAFDNGADFSGVVFSGGVTDFSRAKFSGGVVSFTGAVFSNGTVRFTGARFCGSIVRFSSTLFVGGTVRFTGTMFSGGTVRFTNAVFSEGNIRLTGAMFYGGVVRFTSAMFCGSRVDFSRATFAGSTLDFLAAEFYGGEVDFSQSQFSGGKIDFSVIKNWSYPPQGLPSRPHDVVIFPRDDRDSRCADASATATTQ